MPEPQRPQNQLPIKTYPTPAWGDAPSQGLFVVDEFLTEYVECNKADYVKLPEGSTHPNTRDFPNHRLLKEENQSYGINVRYWCNGFRNQDQYNYDINFSAESQSHPIFTRKYLVRRDQYNPYTGVTREASFTGIYFIKVTNGGSGYDPDDPPSVNISGTGSGASAEAVLDSEGVIIWIYLTSEGTGYTTQPTVTIVASTGSGATAQGFVNADIRIVSGVTITNGGSGYTSAPAVTISAGSSYTATATAQVFNGEVVAVRMTSYGAGYPAIGNTVSFNGGFGLGAAGTVQTEVVSLKMVKEDLEELPNDDPRRALYVLVTRSYESMNGPVLIDHNYEPFIDTYISSLKQIVPGSSVPGDMAYEDRTPGTIVEYRPISFHRYVKITSKINPMIAWENGAEDKEYFGTVNYTFPNEIHDDPSIHVYWALKGTTLAIDFGWVLNVLEGYSGPVRARFRTRYTFDPEDPLFIADLPEITYIQPEADVINDGFIYVGGNLIAQATQFVIPSTLHPQLTIDVTGTGGPVVDLPGPVAVIEATVPTGLTAGQEIIVSVKPEEWRFGLWKYTIISVFVPTPP